MRLLRCTRTPNYSPCSQTMQEHSDHCRHSAPHHSYSDRTALSCCSLCTHHTLLLPLLTWMVAALADPLLTQEGPCECIVQLFVRSFDLTRLGLYCPHFFACTHCSTFAASHFYGVCFRGSYCSQMDEQQNVQQPKWTTWWNHSCYTGIQWLSALHCLQQLQSGACSTSTTQPLSLTQESNVSTPSGSAPNPQQSLSSIVSHFTLGLTRDVRTQTVSLCSLPSTHHATTADASTHLSLSP